MSRQDDFPQAAQTFKRVANIIRKQGHEAGVDLQGTWKRELLQEPAEMWRLRSLGKMFAAFEAAWANDDFDALFSMLAALRPTVDELFDKVMVMCEDPPSPTDSICLGIDPAHGAARFFGAVTLAPHGSRRVRSGSHRHNAFGTVLRGCTGTSS